MPLGHLPADFGLPSSFCPAQSSGPLSREFTSFLWLPKPWNLRDDSLFGGHLSSHHSRPMRRAHEWIHSPRGLCWGHVAQWAAPSVSMCVRSPVPCGMVRAVRVTRVALCSPSAAPTPPVPGLSLGHLQKNPKATGRRTDRAQLCRSEPSGPGRPVPSGCILPAGVGARVLPGEFPQALDRAASVDICRMNG